MVSVQYIRKEKKICKAYRSFPFPEIPQLRENGGLDAEKSLRYDEEENTERGAEK